MSLYFKFVYVCRSFIIDVHAEAESSFSVCLFVAMDLVCYASAVADGDCLAVLLSPSSLSFSQKPKDLVSCDLKRMRGGTWIVWVARLLDWLT